MLESIGFQCDEAEKNSPIQTSSALQVGAGESDWVGRHSKVLYPVLLFSATLFCLALSYYLLQLIVPRRARRVSAGNPSF